MEVRLENLIEKIKSEGVDAANKEAAQIVTGAKKEAAAIIAQAQQEAGVIRSQAQRDAQQMQANAESSIGQAARDTVLKLKGEISGLFERALNARVGAEFDASFMKELITKVVQTLAQGKSVEVVAADVDSDKLLAQIQAALKDTVKGGVNLRLDKRMPYGFQVGLKDQNVYYDFSDESIMESMKLFLNQRLKELLK
jgi:V/A-type H+-transporting ATPase subunit E